MGVAGRPTGVAERLRPDADHEYGATAVEYSLMVALVAGVIVAVVVAFGLEVNDLFATIEAAFP
jgi:Flp pilus assembly pilin Flp